MVDNFKIIRTLLKFEKPGDCYYVQLLRRQSDDPKIGGIPNPAYHGNMYSRSLKDYLISSLVHFGEKEEEIKTLCKTFDVRAYIRLNKRNYKDISMAIFKHITEEICSGDTYASPFHLISSGAGRANSAGKEKTWIVDVDAEYIPHKNAIADMITKCEPFQAREDIIEIPTKHGLHLIAKPFNHQKMNDFWQNYSTEQGITLSLCDIHKDNPTILYVKWGLLKVKRILFVDLHP